MNEGELYYHEMEVDTLARTIWGEARGEGRTGMQAVAWVVMNRLAVTQERGRFWWGHSIIDICHKPYQFSCWNRDDLNYRKLLNIDRRDRVFTKALDIAERVINEFKVLPSPSYSPSRKQEGENCSDITKGATHYHAAGVYPFWARGERPTATIGNHIFYRIVS